MGWVSNRRPLGVGLESRYVSLCLLSAGTTVFAGGARQRHRESTAGLGDFLERRASVTEHLLMGDAKRSLQTPLLCSRGSLSKCGSGWDGAVVCSADLGGGQT